MIRMPRFSIKGLLIILAVVALWFATFNMPDPTNRGIRPQLRLCILLAILIAAGFAAVYFRGKRQAFWSGFLVAMLLLYGRFPHMPNPNLADVAASWSAGLLVLFSASDSEGQMLVNSMWFVLLLSFSSLIGFIVAAIYDQSQPRT